MNRDTDLAWKYHDLTKHSYWSIRRSPHYLDWINQPSPFKIYPDLEPVALPRDILTTGVPTLPAIAAAGVEPVGEIRPGIDQVAGLLY